jgi:two-component system, chemotaxis family, sensor kinase CheA
MKGAKAKLQPDTLDVTQFHAVFFEETAEHLATMEELLIRMNPAHPDPEQLNAVFRAAHSIKGGSGTFGFHEMTRLTHELETLLDKARRNELQLSDAMIDALLQAGDVLKSQLSHFRGGKEAVNVDLEQVCARIRGFVDGAADAPPQDIPALHCIAEPAMRSVDVSFQLAAQTATDADLDGLLGELARFGHVERLSNDQPEDAKRRKKKVAHPITVRLTTGASDDEIRTLFDLVTDPANVAIRVSAGTPVAPAKDEGCGFPTDDAAAASSPETASAVARAVPAVPIADPGYGFFDEESAAVSSPAAEKPEVDFGRRATDHLGVLPDRTGRGGNDKAVAPTQEAPSIRVGMEKVDQLINMVGELVITQAMLAQTVSKLDAAASEALATGVAQLERNTRDLQESIMSVRMMPIAVVFNRFPRLARDLAAKLGKQVQLKTIGEATELDRGLIEKISDPITHLVRNSLDHGIETPETRIAHGKPALGTVTLRAFHRGGSIIIEVSDDGGGLNRERILAKARERGMSVSDDMSDQEVWQIIFEAGFSTADRVSDVSGRGVGMDVVKRNILSMGGRVEIDSLSGQGTHISIRLPLTLAILDGMSIGVGQQTFILPLSNIVESVRPMAANIKSVAGQVHVLEVRGEFLPIIVLHKVFNIRPCFEQLDQGIMVILEADGVKTALKVDELIGQQQVVIKSLEKNYRKVPGIAGATIMGDGQVALILDVPALVSLSRQ